MHVPFDCIDNCMLLSLLEDSRDWLSDAALHVKFYLDNSTNADLLGS